MKNVVRLNRKNACRQGAMLPMIALTLIILIIGVVFSIDIAYMHMVRAELRTATDAAARAGAETLARTQDRGQAIESALRMAELNTVAGQGLELQADQIVLGSVTSAADGKLEFVPEAEPLTTVRVVGDRGAGSSQGSVSLFFGQLLGQTDFEPLQTATASSSVRDIALILDISGSMRKDESGIDTRGGGGDGSPTRLAALQNAVSVFIDEIKASSPNSTLSLTTYSTEADKVTPLTFDLDSIKQATAQFKAQGRTNIFEGLRAGSDSLEQDSLTRPYAQKTIVLMTDGNFNVGGTPIPSAVLAANRGHVINTVSFSSGANQQIMQQVAEIGEGIHLHANDGGDLALAFREIARSLSVILVE